MSVVVGLVGEDGIYLGADGQATDGWQRIEMVAPKVFRCPPLVIGCVGTMRLIQILSTFLVLPKSDGHDPLDFLVRHFVPAVQGILREHDCLQVKDGSAEIAGECECLIAAGNGLFRLSTDFQVIEREGGYDAIGSGAEYALGALEALRSHDLPGSSVVEAAVKAAIAFHMGCGGRITVLKEKFK